MNERSAAPRAMRWILAIALAGAAVATLALILVALVLPARTALALHWYLVAIGAIAAAAATRSLTTHYPLRWRSTEPAADDLDTPLDQPARLRTITRMVSHAEWDAVGFQLELRPILRAIARQRLAAYRTIDIDTEPDAARAVLGTQVWALLTPIDIERAKGSGGVTLSELRTVVDVLEGLDAKPRA